MMAASTSAAFAQPAAAQELFPVASSPASLLQPVAGKSSKSPGSMSSTSSGASAPGAAPGPLELLVNAAQAAVREARPWPIFWNLRALRPPRFDQITARAERNLRVYQGNYKLICAGWGTVAVALTFGRFLAAGLLLLLVERWVRAKLRAEGTLDLNERALATVFGLGIIWVTGVGESVVAATFFSVVTVGLHSVLHDTPLDDEGIEISDV